MPTQEKPWHPSRDKIRQMLIQAVEHVLRKLRHDQQISHEFQQVRQLLDALPLPSGEYATATSRVSSAAMYVASEERGAARYELQLLRGQLRLDDTRNLATGITALRERC